MYSINQDKIVLKFYCYFCPQCISALVCAYGIVVWKYRSINELLLKMGP